MISSGEQVKVSMDHESSQQSPEFNSVSNNGVLLPKAKVRRGVHEEGCIDR